MPKNLIFSRILYFLFLLKITIFDSFFGKFFDQILTPVKFIVSRLTLRMLRASRWVTPLVDLPLIDKTRSPFWIRPSLSANVPGITLWTLKKSNNNIVNWFHVKNIFFSYSNFFVLIVSSTSQSDTNWTGGKFPM